MRNRVQGLLANADDPIENFFVQPVRDFADLVGWPLTILVGVVLFGTAFGLLWRHQRKRR